MTLTIKRISEGWYDFTGINQDHRYVKIHALNCGTDRKATNTARKIAGDTKAQVNIE